MKKFNLLLCSLIAAIPAVAQQQVPDAGFDETWGDCVPWTSNKNTKTNGIQPNSWVISNVIGMNGVGATLVGGEATGVNADTDANDKCVHLFNAPNSILATQIVPGYVTLGTTWSTSVMGQQNDGGTFGGAPFTGRPTKITFMYRRTLGDDANTQPATAVAYLWKGTFTQAEVPGNIGMTAATLVKVDMVDRDRAVLGMETATGGAVTKSQDAELIAKGITSITQVSQDWAKGEIVLEYYSEATPEKINIIFAANDYFGEAANIEKENTLNIDKVECVYENAEPAGDPVYYTGKLVVSMMGDEITSPGGDDATVTITPTGEGTCSFLLPNLSLGELGTLGDIYLPVVNTKTEGDVTTYTAQVKDFELMGGEIKADIDLQGTTNAAGEADMKIAVTWMGIPIDVTFKGNQQGGGVSAPVADSNDAPIEMFDLRGARVDAATTQPGLYIRRQGNNVTKIVIR